MQNKKIENFVKSQRPNSQILGKVIVVSKMTFRTNVLLRKTASALEHSKRTVYSFIHTVHKANLHNFVLIINLL